MPVSACEHITYVNLVPAEKAAGTESRQSLIVLPHQRSNSKFRLFCHSIPVRSGDPRVRFTSGDSCRRMRTDRLAFSIQPEAHCLPSPLQTVTHSGYLVDYAKYPNDRKGVGLMGWGSGRKRFLLRFALRPRSGARHKVSTHLRSGSLVTSLSFLRCAARLARGGLFFHFPKHRRKKHRCNDMSTMQYMRLHCASNSLGASHGAVLCKPRTPGASAHMQTKARHQYEHMKCTIRHR